jgi:molybdenum cofactor cytidylyltransferase
VINQQAERGMGSSIARGVRASQEATGWLINLAHMPYIKTETLTSLANRLAKGSGIVAPQYKQQRGHPVGFGRDYLNELLALDEDTGARNIVKNNRDKIEFVLTNDKGVIQDIDTPGDIYT